MAGRERGLYEVLITEAVETSLRHLDHRLRVRREDFRVAEAADRLGLHLGAIVRRVVAAMPEGHRVAEGIRLAQILVHQIDALVAGSEVVAEAPIVPGTVLRAITALLPDGTPEAIREPLIPLLDTALLTNAPGEPRVGNQLLAEVHSADRIDVVMAFIRRTGIRPLLDALRSHCEHGRPLRVLTTTYTGSTELLALEALREAGANVRVSYDTSTTRLHAKAWLFHRRSGFSTAYIGSSNLTHSAQISGLEWNVRVSGARNPDVIEKVSAVFETYWNSADFVPFSRDEFVARTPSSTEAGVRFFVSPIDLRPYPFQERLLEQIEVSRRRGHRRNLLVAATGTGKTVMAAIDYARLRVALPRARLLFVAHREQILEQSLAVFRHAVRDQAFGELWVGGRRPTRFDHVFASIQSLQASGLDSVERAHFDVVIVDEFHHAAAPSYRSLLEHVQPVELLGLTATPERSDNLPVLEWFENRIAAEIRLWDAIDQQHLAPFSYFGIHDGLDLRDIPWKRGRGYDTTALSNLVTANDRWASLVLSQLDQHVDDRHSMRALGFCVSVEHARYMARVFGDAGIPAVAVWADSPAKERQAALSDLAERRVNAIFSVDLFNEGLDVPVVDTLLLLRPTDSPTLFLQQLGRGLRRSYGKTVCTVLDFVGQHRKEFRFDRRFRALLGGTRKELQEQVERGFPFLPAGCHMELDRVATEHVLRNIRESIPSQWTAKTEELRILARKDGQPVSLTRYLEHSGLDLEDVYAGNRSWSDLRAAAGLPVLSSGPEEVTLRRACGRLLHIDDMLRIEAYRRLLGSDVAPNPSDLSPSEVRLLRMLVASATDKAVSKATSLEQGCQMLWAHPQVLAELRELLEVLADRVDHLHHALPSQSEAPLRVHARYSRLEILAAFGIGEGAKVAPWQTGAYWAKEASTDLFAFTLDKTSGQFSPTTRYRDYAISRTLIHWQSQSVTRADSETGLRYQNHVALGTSVMLFARLRTSDRAFWFLGPATYQSHESELPMSVTWKGGRSRIALRLSDLAPVPSRAQPLFAANHSSPAVSVFQGEIDYPSSPALAHRDAAGWLPSHVVTFPFSTPFVYRGGTLCLEMEGTEVVPGSELWPVDFFEDSGAHGSVQPIGVGCGQYAGGGRRGAGAQPHTLVVGSTTHVFTWGQPGTPAFLMLGAQPFGAPLDPFGAPGCFLHVLPDLTLTSWLTTPTRADLPGHAPFAVQIPGDGSLLSRTFFAQAGNLELRPPFTNAAHLTASQGMALTIGPRVPNLDAAVVESRHVFPYPDRGFVDMTRAPVLRLTTN